MIRIEHLSKKFGEHIIFEDFSCEIQQGDFVVFSGESGKGKTTLLNMIGGIEPFHAGKIYVDELDLSDNKDIITLFREKIGFLFQNFALIEEKTVAENLLIIEPKYRTELSVEEVLEKVGLAGYEKRKVYTLSGGEQQRVALARLFLKKCSVILADEPTGSLDQRNAEIIIKYLFDLKEAGKTIIMVTHDEVLKNKGDYIIEL